MTSAEEIGLLHGIVRVADVGGSEAHEALGRARLAGYRARKRKSDEDKPACHLLLFQEALAGIVGGARLYANYNVGVAVFV